MYQKSKNFDILFDIYSHNLAKSLLFENSSALFINKSLDLLSHTRKFKHNYLLRFLHFSRSVFDISFLPNLSDRDAVSLPTYPIFTIFNSDRKLFAKVPSKLLTLQITTLN